MASFIHPADPNVVGISNPAEDDGEESNQVLVNQQEPQNFGDADNFRDLLCIIIASILCCPLCPCASWMSMYYHQKATESYWRGNYTEAGIKQSVAVKFLIGQCVVSPIILIVLFFLAGSDILAQFYSIDLENGAE